MRSWLFDRWEEVDRWIADRKADAFGHDDG
jgi:hypothetical protein